MDANEAFCIVSHLFITLYHYMAGTEEYVHRIPVSFSKGVEVLLEEEYAVPFVQFVGDFVYGVQI